MLGTDRTDRTERVLCKCSTNCEQSRANDAGFSLDLSEETGHCVDVLPRNSCESERAGRVIEPVWPPRISDLERGRSEDNWVAADVSRGMSRLGVRAGNAICRGFGLPTASFVVVCFPRRRALYV